SRRSTRWHSTRARPGPCASARGHDRHLPQRPRLCHRRLLRSMRRPDCGGCGAATADGRAAQPRGDRDVAVGGARAVRGVRRAAPEIDLAGAHEDPGVSRLHAALERRSDGGYAIRDMGSTNGTTVNDDPAPLARDTAVPLADGDRVRIGAWTTITVRSR